MSKYILILLFLLPNSILFAQEKTDASVVEVERKEVDLNERNEKQNRYNQSLQHARQLIGQRKYEGAAAFLEPLYSENPKNTTVVNLLRTCYTNLNQPLKLENMYKKQIELNPVNLSFRIGYAEAAAQLGNDKDALKRYDDAIKAVRNKNSYRSVLLSMFKYDYTDKAGEIIRNLRIEQNDSTMMVIEMGQYYEKSKQYRKAAEEYYKIFNDTSNLSREAVSRIQALLAFEESSEPTEKFLLELEGSLNNERILNSLSTHYLNSKQYDKAYQYIIKQDSVASVKGSIATSFLVRCYNLKLYDMTIKIGDYIDKTYKDNQGFIVTSYIYYGNACIEKKLYDKAESIYKTIMRFARSPRDKADVINKLGEIELFGRHNYDAALTLFDSVINHFQQGSGYNTALLNRPYCYILQNNVPKALTAYKQIDMNRLNPDLKEEVEYHIGFTYLLNKEIDSAKAVFSKMIVDYPKGFYFNDIMKHMLILDEAADVPTVIYDYSNLLLFKKQKATDSVIVTLRKISDDPAGVLADMALLDLANIYIGQTDTANSLSVIEKLEIEFPDSYYLPTGLKLKADIFYQDTATVDKAVNIYRQLLEEHPFYPFTDEIRSILRDYEQKKSA